MTISAPDWQQALSPVLSEALRSLLAALPARPAALAVGLSGGPDSGVLAAHAAAVGSALGIPVQAWHIHHGLQAQADRWHQQAARLAASLGLPFDTVYVNVARQGGFGLEAAARDARYQGLATLAGRHGVRHLLLAHHQDDQAETVLMRLLRGSGPEGLAAMASVSERDGLVVLRPWLSTPRADLLTAAAPLAEATGWVPVDDPSNRDDAYARGVLRTQFAPVLDAHWPQWRRTMARHAEQCAELGAFVAQAAGADLDALVRAGGGDPLSLPLDDWRALPPARQSALMRHWLARHGLRMPTAARLAELLRQLRQVHARGHDRQLRWRHGDSEIRCVRGRICLHLPDSASYAASQQWPEKS